MGGTIMEKQELEQLVEEHLKDESFILVVFSSFGSIIKSVAMSNVAPGQILELGTELELMGKNGIVQQSNQPPPQQKILVPEPNLNL